MTVDTELLWHVQQILLWSLVFIWSLDDSKTTFLSLLKHGHLEISWGKKYVLMVSFIKWSPVEKPVFCCVHVRFWVQNWESTVECRYSAVQYNMKLYTSLVRQGQNMNVSLNPQQTPQLWGVFCDDFGENRPHYNGTALYCEGWCDKITGTVDSRYLCYLSLSRVRLTYENHLLVLGYQILVTRYTRLPT